MLASVIVASICTVGVIVRQVGLCVRVRWAMDRYECLVASDEREAAAGLAALVSAVEGHAASPGPGTYPVEPPEGAHQRPESG